MPVIQVDAQVSPAKLLSAVKQLSESELEQFALEIAALIAERKAPSLSSRESELLMKINEGLPADLQTRYDALAEKRDAETLSDDEYSELLQLSHDIEMREAHRVERLIELAQLRRVALSTLMNDLGIRAPDHG